VFDGIADSFLSNAIDVGGKQTIFDVHGLVAVKTAFVTEVVLRPFSKGVQGGGQPLGINFNWDQIADHASQMALHLFKACGDSFRDNGLHRGLLRERFRMRLCKVLQTGDFLPDSIVNILSNPALLVLRRVSDSTIETLAGDDMLSLMFAGEARFEIHLANEPVTVHANPTRLCQILVDLVTNAFEALGDEGGEVEIHVGRQDRADLPSDPASVRLGNFNASQYASITVSDNGCGISSADIRRVFEAFYSTKPTGQGLGLSNVQRIILDYGGGIIVDSELNQGTRICCLLPLSGCRDSPENQLTKVGHGEQAVGRIDSKMRILVVDDVPALRHVLKMLLEKSPKIDAQVITAQDGCEAIKLVQEGQGDLTAAIIDWQLPDFAGPQLIDIFRKLAPEIPILLASASSESEMRLACEASPPDAFLTKPFESQRLIDTLLALHR
jgi:CheY-like chemotaxis protein/two-component sensor histidine kinase